NLSQRVRLAEDAGAEITQSCDGVEDTANQQNANIAAENKYGKFPGNLFDHRKDKKNRAEEHLVGNRIEILAEEGLLMEASGEQTVESVAQAGNDKQDQRSSVVMVEQFDHNEGQEGHARQGQLVGRGEDLRDSQNRGL